MADRATPDARGTGQKIIAGRKGKSEEKVDLDGRKTRSVF